MISDETSEESDVPSTSQSQATPTSEDPPQSSGGPGGREAQSGGQGWFSSWGVSSLSSVMQNTTSMVRKAQGLYSSCEQYY